MFVGFELKQTREMNLAELQFNRSVLEHDRYLAILESEPKLAGWAKANSPPTSDSSHLSEIERAAAEVSAMALWLEYRLDFKFIELGFDTRDA